MLTISPEALAIIHNRKQSIFLDMPKLVSSCCGLDVQECPTVRFGKPHNPSEYEEKTIQDVTVFVPRRLTHTSPLTITVAQFFSLKRLVLEGWCMV
jgi:hypothetical protein